MASKKAKYASNPKSNLSRNGTRTSSSQIPIKKTATYLQIYSFIDKQISILTAKPTIETQKQIISEASKKFPEISEAKILIITKKSVAVYEKEVQAHKRQYFAKSAVDQVSQQVFHALKQKQADEVEKLTTISQFLIPIVNAFNCNGLTSSLESRKNQMMTKFELADILEIIRQLPKEKYFNFKKLKDLNLSEENSDVQYNSDDDVVEIESLESKELKKLIRRYLLLRTSTTIQRLKIISKLQKLQKYKQIRETLQQNIIGLKTTVSDNNDIENNLVSKNQIQDNLITSRGVVLDEIAKLRINLGIVIPKLQALNSEEIENNQTKKDEICKVLQDIQQKDLKKRIDKFI